MLLARNALLAFVQSTLRCLRGSPLCSAAPLSYAPPSSPFSRLPLEIVLHILSFAVVLDPQVQSVDKTARRALHPALFHALDLSAEDQAEAFLALVAHPLSTPAFARSVRTLVLRFADAHHLPTLLRACPTIDALAVLPSRDESPALPPSLPYLPALKRLRCPLSLLPALHTQKDTLTHLALSLRPSASPTAVLETATALLHSPTLQTLIIEVPFAWTAWRDPPVRALLAARVPREEPRLSVRLAYEREEGEGDVVWDVERDKRWRDEEWSAEAARRGAFMAWYAQREADADAKAAKLAEFKQAQKASWRCPLF